MRVILERLDRIQEDVGELKKDMAKLAEAVIQVARMDERMASHSEALNRAFVAIDGLDSRVKAIEGRMPLNNLVTTHVISASIGVLGVVAGVIGSKLLGL